MGVAIKYFREHGLKKSKKHLLDIREAANQVSWVHSLEGFSQDLKRLVESHDLVINWKLPEDDETGLDGAHLYLDYYATYSNDEEKAKLDRLKQAIADVEACGKVGS